KFINMNNLKTTLIFHKNIESKMINNFISQESHKNLIPEYLENVLPQAIIMFNHYLYNQMMKYQNIDKVTIDNLFRLITINNFNDDNNVNTLLNAYKNQFAN